MSTFPTLPEAQTKDEESDEPPSDKWMVVSNAFAAFAGGV